MFGLFFKIQTYLLTKKVLGYIPITKDNKTPKKEVSL